MTDYSTFSLPAAPETRHTAKVKADVEFGVMQANGECVGVGICRIITTHQLHTTRTHQRRCARCSLFERLRGGALRNVFSKKRDAALHRARFLSAARVSRSCARFFIRRHSHCTA